MIESKPKAKNYNREKPTAVSTWLGLGQHGVKG